MSRVIRIDDDVAAELRRRGWTQARGRGPTPSEIIREGLEAVVTEPSSKDRCQCGHMFRAHTPTGCLANSCDCEGFASPVADRDDWPVHRPEATDAPIPGRHWYSACEPGDYDSERGYHGAAGRVDPTTGACTACGETACRVCGRENCPDGDHGYGALFVTKTGRVLTDADFEALADEAERGYDPADFRKLSDAEVERLREKRS